MWPWPKGSFDKVQEDITERNRMQSLSLYLPSELRLTIYEYTMDGERINMHDVIVRAGNKAEAEVDLRAGHGPDMDVIITNYKIYHASNLLGLLYTCHPTRVRNTSDFRKIELRLEVSTDMRMTRTLTSATLRTCSQLRSAMSSSLHSFKRVTSHFCAVSKQ
jgi:hypothetical protein